MMHFNDRGQETIENFDTRKLKRMQARMDNIRQEFWDRHGYEAYEPICRIIKNELNFRDCQDAADRRFCQDAYGDCGEEY
jgi:hypothetical protein